MPNSLPWKCMCGHENWIKLPCTLPKDLKCVKCGTEYMMYKHTITYMNTKGELIEIVRDLTQL